MPVSGDQGPTEHPHVFICNGDEKCIVKVEVDTSKGEDKLITSVTAGLSDLLGTVMDAYLPLINDMKINLTKSAVLKTTESAFTGFVYDKYTTLKEVGNRILSTSINLSYKFSPVGILKPTDADVEQFAVPITPGSVWDTSVPINAHKVTLNTFASDNSASVQATLYRMARLIIVQNTHVQTVSYALPNKHYIPIDMGYLGVENLVPGLITTTVSCK
ncbi:hypothetical protein B0H14DRAFT_3451138 [Mycena olivaceomarginata]|nr:hypothetical protein B0H14DRAFT_3451138 [Mycena olivaceomarginata]